MRQTLLYIVALITVLSVKGQSASSPTGYLDMGDSIEFIFGQQSKIRIGNVQVLLKDRINEIHELNVAGDFNNWNPKDSKYIAVKGSNQQFRLTVAKSQLGKKGELRQFKFVINHTWWVEPPAEAVNQFKGRDGNTNLTLKL